MTQTNDPLFDSFTEEQKQRYLRWTTLSDCKSKVLTELNKKLPSVRKSGYSCNMIIIDDLFENPNITQEDIDKVKKRTMFFYKEKVAKIPLIPENVIVATDAVKIFERTWSQDHD